MARGQTGLGVTAALTTGGTIGLIQSLQLPSWELESVDFTNLSDPVWQVFLSGQIRNPGQAVFQLYMDVEGAVPELGTIDTLTITFPNPGGTTPGQLVGSGFLNMLEFPNAAVNEAMVMTLGFQYDGLGTTPSLTPGS